MSSPNPHSLRDAWLNAPDPVARAACISQLLSVAANQTIWKDKTAATRHLIELVHLADHPLERARLVRALGRSESAMVVPAVHAELHSSSPEVVRAAIEALGELGFVFGGSAVDRWLSTRKVEDEAPGTGDAALLALARTGHHRTVHWAGELWKNSLVEASTLHLALAEAVADSHLELAKQHVSSPDAGISAALHLSALRVPHLPRLLRPLLHSNDLTRVHVAERILAMEQKDALSEVGDLLRRDWRPAPLARAARRLRVHPSSDLIDAFEIVREDHPKGSKDRRKQLSRLLLAGIPELQAELLRWTIEQGNGGDIASVLGGASVPHPGLKEQLAQLMRHDNTSVAVKALRCRVNVLGDLQPDDLCTLMEGGHPSMQCEAVRSLMTLYRDHKGSNGKSTLTGGARRAAETLVHRALQEGDENTRKLAAYTVGNMGLQKLTREVYALREDASKDVRQGAAASLHTLPPSVAPDDLVAWAHREPSADVRVRLLLALEDALVSGKPVPSKGMPELLAPLISKNNEQSLLAIRLYGWLKGTDATDQLVAAASDPRLAIAATALTAIGTQGDHRALPALLDAARADDPVRRRHAVESLARFPATEAGDTLVAVACEESDQEVRRAALLSLVARPCDATSARRLVTTNATDPLLFEILQARAAAGGGTMDAAAVDDRLRELLPTVRVSALKRTCPAALQALRTAVFLDAGVAIPEGLDAAPPALFWVKGLELWFDTLLRPLRLSLRTHESRQALNACASRWPTLSDRAPGWPRDTPVQKWTGLLAALLPELTKRQHSVWSLRAVAAALLCAGPLAPTIGLTRWLPGDPDGSIGPLASELVRLADIRNRLTHREAGRADEAVIVRQLSISAIARVHGLFR